MKQNIFSLCLLLCVVTSSLAKEADPIFYLKNKSKGRITAIVSQGGSSEIQQTLAANTGELIITAMDRTTDTVLEILFTGCKKVDACEKGEEPTYDKRLVVTIKKSKDNKKIYLKFKDNGKLLPQVGKKGKTENGKYSLGLFENIGRSDFRGLEISDVKPR